MKYLSASTLLLLSLTVAGQIVSERAADAQRLGPDAPTIAEQYLLSAANQERVARGLSELHRDPQLARAAAEHAREMAKHASISHQFAGEAELTSRGASAGVSFSLISENVAEAPRVIEIHQMWMRSAHHRTNLLDPAIDSAGISVVERNGELYAVEDFARTVRSMSLERQESAIGLRVLQPGRITLVNDAASVAAARATCATSTGYVGARKPWFVMRFTSDDLSRLPDALTAKMASGRYREAAVGACASSSSQGFTSYSFAVLLYP
jgi:uncharacterized protein YkwD